MGTYEDIPELPQVTLDDKIYSIAEITAIVKTVLEETVGAVWVEGEISNYKHHSSGHRYFSLKDNSASLRCVMWRQVGRGLDFEPTDGLRVRAFGRLTVYPPQGSYQLVASRMAAVGVGPLEVAFQKLKEKLFREGLFDEERKRPLPELPTVVGVVTSETGAAFVDISRTVVSRFAGLKIVLCPARVQGEGAAGEIVHGIKALNRRDDVDLIIIGRGGGSLEDLWAFNEESVARAVVASRLPIISAVGHEVDFTIADGVADWRAATPTAAAQVVTEGWVTLKTELPNLARRLRRAEGGMVENWRVHLDQLRRSHALGRPADLLDVWAQRLDDTTERLRLRVAERLRRSGEMIRSAEGRLNALSPDGVLQRGYSITRPMGSSTPLRRSSEVKTGELVETRLAEGTVISIVEETGN